MGSATIDWMLAPYATATVNAVPSAGVDVVGASSGSLVFAEGATTATITFEIVDDADAEGDEYSAVLLDPASDLNITAGAGTVTVADDDEAAPAPGGAGGGSGGDSGPPGNGKKK